MVTYSVNPDEASFHADLAAAAGRGEFMLNWQPIACLRTGATLGFEALLRWHHPVRGQVRPDTFINFAEDHDLIADIDAWVMDRACQEAASWPVPLRLSVNVSARTFLHQDFPARTLRTLHRFAVDPNRLEIEVTERVVIADVALFSDHVRALGALGSRVVLDDFGTGYSSLSLLGVFPIHKFKLDRSFSRRLGTNTRADTVVRAILQLGTALGVITCAEGIESDRQMSVLQRHGCNEVQGYLIGRPGLLVEQDFAQAADTAVAAAVRDGAPPTITPWADGPSVRRMSLTP